MKTSDITPESIAIPYPASPPSDEQRAAFHEAFALHTPAEYTKQTPPLWKIHLPTPPPQDRFPMPSLQNMSTALCEEEINLFYQAILHPQALPQQTLEHLLGHLCDWIVEKTDASEERHKQALDRIEYAILRVFLEDQGAWHSPSGLLSVLSWKRSHRMNSMWRSLLEQVSPDHPHYWSFVSCLSWSQEDQGFGLLLRHHYAIHANHRNASAIYRSLVGQQPNEMQAHALYLFRQPECPESLRFELLEDAIKNQWIDFLMPQIEGLEAHLQGAITKDCPRWYRGTWLMLRMFSRYWRGISEELQQSDPALFAQAIERIEALSTRNIVHAAMPVLKNIGFGLADWAQSIEGFDVWIRHYLHDINHLIDSPDGTIWQRAVATASWIASPSSLQKIAQTWQAQREEKLPFVLQILPRWREPSCVQLLFSMFRHPLHKNTKQQVMWALIRLCQTPNCWPDGWGIFCMMEPILGKDAEAWEAAISLFAEANDLQAQKEQIAQIMQSTPLDPAKAWACFAWWFVRPDTADASWFVALLLHKDHAIQHHAAEIFSTHPRHVWLPALEQWLAWACQHGDDKAAKDPTICAVLPRQNRQEKDLAMSPTSLPPESFDLSAASLRRMARILRRMRIQCAQLETPLQDAQHQMEQALFST